MDPLNLSIVVPCYNEQDNIAALVEAFSEVAATICATSFELVLVDNGSTDRTRERIQAAQTSYSFVTLAVVETNCGYGYGILAGLAVCRGDYLGWLHADLQVLPREILCGLTLLAKQTDPQKCFVKGLRKARPLSDTLFTLGMSGFETFYLREALYDINAQPTLFHRNFYAEWVAPPHDFSLDLYAFYFARLKKLSVLRFPIFQHEREHGNSSWNTGLKSRVKLVKRVLSYSRTMKQQQQKIRGGCTV